MLNIDANYTCQIETSNINVKYKCRVQCQIETSAKMSNANVKYNCQIRMSTITVMYE